MNAPGAYENVRQLEADEIADKLKTFVQGQAPVSERLLANTLGIKRHQVRRGLQVLRDRGEIALPKPRRKSPDGNALNLADIVSNTNPVQVLEMRCIMEPTLARIAALRATPKQIDAMRKAADQIASGKKHSHNIDLHTMIAEASGNAFAERIYRLVRAIERDARLRSDGRFSGEPVDPVGQPADAAGHSAIVEAIAARDADAAEEAMHDHLDMIRAAISTIGR